MTSHLFDPVELRPPQFAGERRDCTVFALMHLLDISYPLAHAVMKRAGRTHGRGWAGSFKRALPSILNGRMVARSGTVRKFISQHPTGRFLLWVRGHVFALIDGAIIEPKLVETTVGQHVLYAYSVGPKL